MASLDTNVLVRFLVDDDAEQSAAARHLVARSIAAGDPLFVSLTVALELEWVLRSRYGFSKTTILATFADLLSSTEVGFASESTLEVALALYADGSADFSDALHVAVAHRTGHAPLWTFDHQASKLAGARLIRSSR